MSLLHYAEQFSPQFVAKLEDRIADLVEEISPGRYSEIVLLVSYSSHFRGLGQYFVRAGQEEKEKCSSVEVYHLLSY